MMEKILTVAHDKMFKEKYPFNILKMRIKM